MGKQMTVAREERYCSVEESIRESFKEIKLIHEGKRKKNSLDDLWKQIEEWKKEDGI